MNTSQINDGGPAFSSWPYKPWKHEPSINEMNYYSGMTLRDWFAGQALDSIISGSLTNARDGRKVMTNAEMVNDAYVIADAMIAQRNKV